MKKKSIKILSVFLLIAMLFSVCFAASIEVLGDSASTAKVTSAKLSESSGGVCSSHSVGSEWLIDICFDKDIIPDTSDVSTYFQEHLTVSSAKSKSENTTCGTELSSLILINGKTISSCYTSEFNQYKALHVQFVSEGDSNYLRLAIPKSNVYSLDPSKGFTVTLSAGIKFNGFSVESEEITYDSASQKFSLKSEGSQDPDTDGTASVILENTKISTSQDGVCSSHAIGAEWLIDIYFDKDIVPETSDIARYYQQHLTVAEATSTSGDTTCGTALSSLILINGKRISSCYTSEYGQYKALHVQLISEDDKNYLRLAIPQGNMYGFDATKDFTVTLSSGIKFNGFSVNPVELSYDVASEKFSLKSNDSQDPDAEKTTSVQLSNTKITSQNSICDTHSVGEEWWVDVYFDQDIIPLASDVTGYYQKHLTVTAATSSTGETTVGSELCGKIFLNDKTIDACYGSRGQYTALHVQIINGASGKYLRFAIPKDNSYSFNGDSNFSIIFCDGIKLNGYTVKPTVLSYSASENKFSTEDYISDDDDSSGDGSGNDVTNPIEVKLNSVETGTCAEHDKGAEWVTDIYFDKNVVPVTDDVSSYYQKHLTVVHASSTAEITTVGTELCNLIRINGKPIDKIYTSDRGQYNAIHVQLLKGPQGKFLRIAVPKDNTYGFKPENGFNITLKGGIMFNGYSVSPSIITYKPSDQSFNIQPYVDTGDGTYHVLGTDTDENGNSIKIWASGTSKYVDFILSDYLIGTSKNSEALTTEHGEASRNCIFIDGLSVGEWMNYGAGNLYQVMVRFENNYIRFLLDGSREPGMSQEEYHWVEFTEGLIGASGEVIAPCKLYYDPNTLSWSIVDSFDGLEKPWWITNFEKYTEFAEAGLKSDSSYVRPLVEWEDSAITLESEDSESADEFEKSEDSELIDKSENSEDSKLSAEDKPEKVVVKVKKKVKGDVIYEEYFPTWALILIIAGAVIIVGGTVFLIIFKRKRKKKLSM